MTLQPVGVVLEFLGKGRRGGRIDDLPVVRIPTEKGHVERVAFSGLSRWITEHTAGGFPLDEADLLRDYERFLADRRNDR